MVTQRKKCKQPANLFSDVREGLRNEGFPRAWSIFGKKVELLRNKFPTASLPSLEASHFRASILSLDLATSRIAAIWRRHPDFTARQVIKQVRDELRPKHTLRVLWVEGILRDCRRGFAKHRPHRPRRRVRQVRAFRGRHVRIRPAARQGATEGGVRAREMPGLRRAGADAPEADRKCNSAALLMAPSLRRFLLPTCYHSAPNQPDIAEHRPATLLRKSGLSVWLCPADSALNYLRT